MGILFLLLILLVCAAAIYGVFFLIFKVVWLIAKKEGNKWPLVLAGGATAVATLVFIISVYTAYNTFFKPFSGLIASASAKTELSQGDRLYKDGQYGFSMTTFGGMEFSNWINYKGTNLKAGFDTNTVVLMRQTKEEEEKENLPFAGFIFLHNTADKPVNTQQEFSSLLEQFEKMSDGKQFQLDSSEQIDLGGQPALLISGTVQPPNVPETTLHAYLLSCAEGKDRYYMAAVAKGDEAYLEQVLAMVKSFRLPSSAAAATEPPAQANLGDITGFVPTNIIMD